MDPRLAARGIYFPLTKLAGQPVGRYLDEYRARDSWTSDRLYAFQRECLKKLLSTAATRCSFYRARWTELPDLPQSAELLSLANLPSLSRNDVLESEAGIRVAGPLGRVVRKTSGGSTGRPVTIIKSADALARERAATWRGYGWAGIDVAAPQARLWGVPISRKGRLVAALLDKLGNRVRLSAFGFTEESIANFVARIHRFKPHFIYGYVSLIVELCRFLEATQGRLPGSVKCVITTAEVLDEQARSYIHDVTQLRAYNEYGCGEVGSIAHECDAGQLHIMADNLIVEEEVGNDLPFGLCHLLVTDLHNLAMPLIRYRLGDLGSLSRTTCPCGKPYPVLAKIVGRAYDVIVGSGGKRYHPEAVLYAFEELKRDGVTLPPFQVVQSRDGELCVRLTESEVVNASVRQRLVALLKASLGDDLSVEFDFAQAIEREPSGKLRVVKRLTASSS